MTLPKRPRSHQLESASRAALRSVIPESWVFRDLDQDYGIDAEIELFDADEFATGAKLYIQLKATDAPLEGALRMRLRRETGAYYESLDIPVLIVMYHAATGQLFTRWFHTIDPGEHSAEGSRTVRFNLDADRVWIDRTPELLARELQAYRQLRARKLPRPLCFALEAPETLIHGVPRFQILSHLRASATRTRGLVAFSAAPDQQWCPHRVFLSGEKLEVALSGTRGFLIDVRGEYLPNKDAKSIAQDVMVAIAMALSAHGHNAWAADILALFAAGATLCRDPEGALDAAIVLASARRVDIALEIADTFYEDERTVRAAQTMMLAALVRQADLTKLQRDFLLKLLTRRAEWFAANGDGKEASTHYYNAGQILRSESRYREAIRMYSMAARSAAQYWSRPYFLAELAGMLFLQGRYRIASELYGRAADREDTALGWYLFADALLFHGRYAAALQKFEEASTREAPATLHREIRLRSLAAQEILRTTGLDVQTRQVRSAGELLRQPIGDDPGEGSRVYREALGHDGLCEHAWYNLAVARDELGDRPGARNAFLVAAILRTSNVDAWIHAAFRTDPSQPDLGIDVLAAGYRYNGEALLDRLGELCASGEEGAQAIAELGAGIQELAHMTEPFTLRLHHPDGSIQQIHLNMEHPADGTRDS